MLWYTLHYQKFIKQLSDKRVCLNTYCPLECDHLSYEIILNSLLETGTGNTSSKALNYYAGFNTYENVSKTFHSIIVYYQELKYTLIKQQPKIELFSLISNIGGILGLFIGFSCISILELIEVVAELVFIKFNS